MGQAILTIIFYVWMFIALALWFLMWRESRKRTTRLQESLLEFNKTASEAAKAAAEAARQAVLLLEKKLDV